MEPDADFNLENAIADWRDELAGQPGLGDDNLRELESHLREVIATQMKLGNSYSLAFASAAKQIGNPAVVVGEFAKENPGLIWRQRIFWMAFGAITIPFVLYSFALVLGLLDLWQQKSRNLPVLSEWLQTVQYLELFAVGPALVIGFLRILAHDERLRLTTAAKWLAAKPYRNFLVVTIPAIAGLSTYITSDQSPLNWIWMRNLAISLGFAIVLMALPVGSGNRARRLLNWLIAGRFRMAGILALATASNALGLVAYFMPNLPPQTIKLMKLQAGSSASMYTVELLLFIAAILCQSSVRSEKRHYCRGTSDTQYSAGATRLWRRRVQWISSGLLALFAWHVLEDGLHQVVVREIDFMWLRIAIGVLVPLSLAVWVWRFVKSDYRSKSLRRLETIAGKPVFLLTAAALISALALQFRITFFYETIAEVFGGGTHLLANAIQTWLVDLIWPAIMLAFLLWQKRYWFAGPDDAPFSQN